MRNLFNRVFNHRALGWAAVSAACLAVVTVAFVALQPTGDTKRSLDDGFPDGGGFPYWTMIGAAGLPDEVDFNIVVYTGAIASIDPAAGASSNVVLRYPVTTNANLTSNEPDPFLYVRYRDNGAGARVIAYLKEFDLLTGTTVTRMTLNSDQYAANNGYQARFVTPTTSFSFDFSRKAYWVDVILTRTNSSGNPAIAMVMVGRF